MRRNGGGASPHMEKPSNHNKIPSLKIVTLTKKERLSIEIFFFLRQKNCTIFNNGSLDR